MVSSHPPAHFGLFWSSPPLPCTCLRLQYLCVHPEIRNAHWIYNMTALAKAKKQPNKGQILREVVFYRDKQKLEGVTPVSFQIAVKAATSRQGLTQQKTLSWPRFNGLQQISECFYNRALLNERVSEAPAQKNLHHKMKTLLHGCSRM